MIKVWFYLEREHATAVEQLAASSGATRADTYRDVIQAGLAAVARELDDKPGTVGPDGRCTTCGYRPDETRRGHGRCYCTASAAPEPTPEEPHHPLDPQDVLLETATYLRRNGDHDMTEAVTELAFEDGWLDFIRDCTVAAAGLSGDPRPEQAK
jgi:hypothetical protein